MPTIIVMPQLGESVAEGVIGKWLKNEGDAIEKDEPIVEVITDKVNAEIPSPVAGVLEKITQPEGATVAVGQEIAVIGGGAESDGGSTTGSASAGDSHSGMTPSGNGQGLAGAATMTAQRQTGQVEGVAAAPSGRSERVDRVRSSPLVRRLAEQYGINLTQVPGTGIGGRVSKQDILQYVEQRQRAGTVTEVRPAATVETPALPQETAAAPAPVAVAPPSAAVAQSPPSGAPSEGREPGTNEERIPLTPLRKMIADRMAQSVYTIPHAVTNSEVDMSAVVRYRDARKDEFRSREGRSLSLVAFFVKATVDALKAFPMVNAEWGGDCIILKKDVNINIAVDAPDGLITPVIRHADDLSLAGLSKAIVDIAERARNKKLKVEDMQGGTFTVNNTGALGSVSGVSIINYPQGGLLAFGSIVKRPVVVEVDDQDLIAVRSMMTLGFSFDHRLLDGGYAAAFARAVKDNLESWPQDYPLY